MHYTCTCMMGCTSKAELVRSYLLDNKHTSRIYYSLQFYNLICSFLYYRGGVYRDTILCVTNHLQATRNREVHFSVSENYHGEVGCVCLCIYIFICMSTKNRLFSAIPLNC